ncbi:AAA family ATPase [Butyrivibrio sp. MB2005]|uniref:AAA family ATPase n=1 Tax=Butyrivibrio sp. MB2005 TaxID=1280678 RepID=UPI00040887BF|nr:AAA family ATPase [Butyrivibrio sp. MB2005]
MRVYLNNIGVIRDSEIEINEITLITGYNDSGKTTAGKTINAIFSAVEDIFLNALADKIAYINIVLHRRIRNIIPVGANELNLSNRISQRINEWLNIGFAATDEEIKDLCNKAKSIIEDISQASDEQIDGLFKEPNRSMLGGRVKIYRDNGELLKTIALIETMEQLITDDPQAMKYADRKIIKYLQSDFFDQITPVRYKDRVGEILVKENDANVFNIRIRKNEIEGTEHLYNYIANSEIEKVIMIDDSDVLDEIYAHVNKQTSYGMYHDQLELSDYYQTISVRNRKEKLSNYMFPHNYLYQEIENEERAQLIFEKIDEAFNDEVIISGNKMVCAGSKLDVRNLAAGSKLFAIIRQLLLKGQLDNKTLLIMDEPDDHLHPEWQVLLAEVLALLNKELGVKILLTTHSTNLVYGFEVIQKREKKQSVKLYDTIKLEDEYSVMYKDVSDDYSEVYSKLGAPFINLRREESLYDN